MSSETSPLRVAQAAPAWAIPLLHARELLSRWTNPFVVTGMSFVSPREPVVNANPLRATPLLDSRAAARELLSRPPRFRAAGMDQLLIQSRDLLSRTAMRHATKIVHRLRNP